MGIIKSWKLKRYCKKSKIYIEGKSPKCIGGYYVPEFNYLMSYISSNKIESLNDIDVIHSNFSSLMKGIEGELFAVELSEEKDLQQAHSIAINNMKNLKKIITNIYEYVEFKTNLYSLKKEAHLL
jgi:hypothetical protein